MPDKAINALPPWIDPSDYSEWKREQREENLAHLVVNPAPKTEHEGGLSNLTVSNITEPVSPGKQLSFDLFPDNAEHVQKSSITRTIVETDIALPNGNVKIESVVINIPGKDKKDIILTALDAEGNPIGYKDLKVLHEWAFDAKTFGSEDDEVLPEEIAEGGIPFKEIREHLPELTLFVVPYLRQRGIGEKLFSMSLEIAKELGAKRYELDMEQDGTRLFEGRSWYERFNPRIEGDSYIFDLV